MTRAGWFMQKTELGTGIRACKEVGAARVSVIGGPRQVRRKPMKGREAKV